MFIMAKAPKRPTKRLLVEAERIAEQTRLAFSHDRLLGRQPKIYDTVIHDS